MPEENSRTPQEFTVRAIGTVRSPITQAADDCWGGVQATIALDPAQFSSEATAGLSDFSHVEVIFLFDRIAPEKVLMTGKHPREREDWPFVGIFAQRAKNRPNRLGVTVCKLEKVDGINIHVRELDAIDGTPVLDIKPYLPGFAPKGAVREPAWSSELMAGYFRAKS